jgi:hypothetical protein
MRQAYLFAAFAALLVTACGQTPNSTSSSIGIKTYKYYYNSRLGGCYNSDGREGLNSANIASLFANPMPTGGINFRYYNVDAECVDLRSVNFSDYLGQRYDELVDWNLRGAVFDGSQFTFANLTGADLSGAQLGRMLVGYTLFSNVIIDPYTVLPAGMACTPTSVNTLMCTQ